MSAIRSFRWTTACSFLILGPIFLLASGLIGTQVRADLTSGDVTPTVLAVMLFQHPEALALLYAQWLLPFLMTGLFAVVVQTRLKGLAFVAICAAMGGIACLAFDALSGQGPPDPVIALQGGLAALACAALSCIRRRSPELLPSL